MFCCWFFLRGCFQPVKDVSLNLSQAYQVRSTVKLLNKFGHPKKCCNYPKTGTVSFYYRVMGPKDADGMANSGDPYQTAPLGDV